MGSSWAHTISALSYFWFSALIKSNGNGLIWNKDTKGYRGVSLVLSHSDCETRQCCMSYLLLSSMKSVPLETSTTDDKNLQPEKIILYKYTPQHQLK